MADAHWKANPREALAWPVLDTYRVGLEIAVKDAIRLAARCLRSDGACGADVNPGILEARLSGRATVESLVRHFAALARRVPHGGAAPAGHALGVLQGLSALDSPADAALLVRYDSTAGASLVPAGAGARRDADLEAVCALLTEAIMFLAHEASEALSSFLAVRGESAAA